MSLGSLCSLDITFKRFVGSTKTVVADFRLFPTEAVEYLSVHSVPTLPGTSPKAQGQPDFCREAANRPGRLLVQSRLVSQTSFSISVSEGRSKGVEWPTLAYTTRRRCPSPSLSKTHSTGRCSCRCCRTLNSTGSQS